MSAIIVHGNPIDGLSFIGPFPDLLAAAAHGDRVDLPPDWWVIELTAPDDPGKVAHAGTMVGSRITCVCGYVTAEYPTSDERHVEFNDHLAANG